MLLNFFVWLTAAAAREAERSCAMRNTHFHHQVQHHASAGCSTGLPWLGTAAPKASVFAPLSDTTSSQPNPIGWGSQNEKNLTENSRYRGSPVKHESNSVRSTSTSAASANECSESAEINSGRSEGNVIEVKSSSSLSTSSNTGSNNFYAFPTPPKDDTDSGLPLTPASVISTSSATRPVQQSESSRRSFSEQKSVGSTESCPQSIGQTSLNAQPYHQQQAVAETAKLELPQQQASSATLMSSFSQPYKPASAAEYSSSISTYQTTDCNKTSLSTYMNKSKSKNRTATGMWTDFEVAKIHETFITS